MRNRSRLGVAVGALLVLGGIGLWAMGRRSQRAPQTVSQFRATGPLSVGAAAVEMEVPYPISPAGYPSFHASAKSSVHPLKARAVVLKMGAVTFGVVSLDLLLVPEDLVAEIRKQSALSEVWVVATHAHSSMGGIDKRLLAQVAATGRFRSEAHAAAVDAAVRALHSATQTVTPVEVEMGNGTTSFNESRSGGSAEAKISKVRFGQVAQWLLLAAHPTLVSRTESQLHPDYPGFLADGASDGVTQVLQTAVGNARAKANDAKEMAARVGEEFKSLAMQPLPVDSLEVKRVRFSLPNADTRRLLPSFLAPLGDLVLNAWTPDSAEIGVLKLGGITSIAMPFELTQAAATSFAPANVLSVTNGYLGYVEPSEKVVAGEGESKRQYFSEGLLGALKQAAEAP